MPQKTKKEKMKSQERKEVAKVKSTLADSKEENTHYFIRDMKKSLTLVALILLLEAGIYIASINGLIPFIPQA